MFNTTVTVFNQQDGIWYPHVLHHAQTSKDKGYLLRQYGADENNAISVFVHYTESEGEKYIEDYRYCEPKQYESEDATECITFRGGTKFDIIVLGEYTNEVDDSAYPKGFYDYLRTHRDGVYAINSVSGAFGVIPHFEITGR